MDRDKASSTSELDNLFEVISSVFAFEVNMAVSHLQFFDAPLNPNRKRYVSFSTLTTLGPTSTYLYQSISIGKPSSGIL